MVSASLFLRKVSIMFLQELIAALIIALFLGTVFAAFGWRGTWEGIWVFFLVMFLFIWAGGIWARPYGPVIWGINWVPFLLFGLLLGFLLMAAAPAVRPERGQRAEGPDAAAKNRQALAVNFFFWILLFTLALAIAVRYLV